MSTPKKYVRRPQSVEAEFIPQSLHQDACFKIKNGGFAEDDEFRRDYRPVCECCGGSGRIRYEVCQPCSGSGMLEWPAEETQ